MVLKVGMLSVIIPVFNQGKKVKGNLRDLVDILEETPGPYEIIFIDDGSSDETPEILEYIHKSNPKTKLISLRKNLGQHNALFIGFRHARGDIIITMDADAKVSPCHIPQLVSKIKEGYDIAVAARCSRPGLSLARKCGSYLINEYTNLVTRKKLRDHACSLKAFRADIVKARMAKLGSARFFGIMIDKHASKICQVPVACAKKSSGESSLNIFGLSRQAIYFITSTIFYRN